MFVSTDRWTCPHIGCPHPTVVIVVGSDADTHAAIEAVQRRHGEAHRHAATVLQRLGLPPAPQPQPPKPKPRARRRPKRTRTT